MALSQNGYPANDRSHITTYLVGTKTKFALRKGPTGWLLAHFAAWFDAHIRDIDAGSVMDDWSYAERPIRGSTTTLSNHASGTAIDVDATRWPLGVEPSKYLAKEEIAKVRQQLALYEGAIRWGGDYTGRKDPMHFEINKPEAFCARIQAKLQGGGSPDPAPTSDPGDDMYGTNERNELIARIDEMRGELDVLVPQVAEMKDGMGRLLDAAGATRAMVANLFARQGVDVDEAALAKDLAPLLTANARALSDADVRTLAAAFADEADRRDRDGDPATGTVS